MTEKLYDKIPSLDLSDFTHGNSSQKENFVNSLGEAYADIGFVAIKNHGLSDRLVENLYSASISFFDLPLEKKLKYKIPGIFGQRGYTGKGEEHAKGRSTGDLKEFYHIGQNKDLNDPISENYPDNVWPEEVPAFEDYGSKAFEMLENAGLEILKAIALFLKLPEDYFDSGILNGNSILRPIHYFPIHNPEEVPSDAVRAAQHGDINLITLLMGASADGLQVLRKDGEWISITALPDQLVVNVGDMMERLTNNVLKSTIHRVVNPPTDEMNKSRYSIPFFMHPRSDMDLSCLENCISEANPKNYEDITAGDFLHERLKEIGLM